MVVVLVGIVATGIAVSGVVIAAKRAYESKRGEDRWYMEAVQRKPSP